MKYVAFLRGIMPQMIASHRMENLRTIFEDLGFSNVQSFIASGNIIFESTEKNKEKLETKIEKALREKTDRETPTIIRTKEELEKLIKSNPFSDIKVDAKNKPHVTFLKKGGEVGYTVNLTTTKTPNVMAELEKKYGKEITTRTWNTVQRITKLL